MKKLLGSILAAAGIASVPAAGDPPASLFEQAVLVAKETNEFMPVWELFVNTQFYVIIERGDAGPKTTDFRFQLYDSPKNEPTVLISEQLSRLASKGSAEAIKMSGGKLVQLLHPDVGILIAITDGAFGMPVDQVQWLRESIQTAD